MNSKKINNLIIILCIYAISLTVFRVKVTDSGFYLFLIWNLFLAIIPFLITNYLKQQTNRFLLYMLFPFWLLFLPNAPYIITDLFHLEKGTLMPIWFDLLLIISFAICGMLLFFTSLNDMFNILTKYFSKKTVWFVTIVSLFLSGFGIYLGRFLRWNSWEILNKPLLLFRDIWNPIMHPIQYSRTWGITFGFGFLFLICFLIFKNLLGVRNDVFE